MRWSPSRENGFQDGVNFWAVSVICNLSICHLSSVIITQIAGDKKAAQRRAAKDESNREALLEQAGHAASALLREYVDVGIVVGDRPGVDLPLPNSSKNSCRLHLGMFARVR